MDFMTFCKIHGKEIGKLYKMVGCVILQEIMATYKKIFSLKKAGKGEYLEWMWYGKLLLACLPLTRNSIFDHTYKPTKYLDAAGFGIAEATGKEYIILRVFERLADALEYLPFDYADEDYEEKHFQILLVAPQQSRVVPIFDFNDYGTWVPMTRLYDYSADMYINACDFEEENTMGRLASTKTSL